MAVHREVSCHLLYFWVKMPFSAKFRILAKLDISEAKTTLFESENDAFGVVKQCVRCSQRPLK